MGKQEDPCGLRDDREAPTSAPWHPPSWLSLLILALEESIAVWLAGGTRPCSERGSFLCTLDILTLQNTITRTSICVCLALSHLSLSETLPSRECTFTNFHFPGEETEAHLK